MDEYIEKDYYKIVHVYYDYLTGKNYREDEMGAVHPILEYYVERAKVRNNSNYFSVEFVVSYPGVLPYFKVMGDEE